MEEDFTEPFILQLYADIFDLFYQKFAKGKRITPKEYKAKIENVLNNGMGLDKQMTEHFCDKAAKKIDHDMVLNGETLCRCLLKQLIGESVNNKPVDEQLQYGYDMLKNLFYKIVKDVTSLYASSIIEHKHGDQIMAMIREETQRYFNNIKTQYGRTTLPIVGGIPSKSVPVQSLLTDAKDKNYKQKYKDLKTRLVELERQVGETKSSQDKLDRLDDYF
jgi:hypothetical protein